MDGQEVDALVGVGGRNENGGAVNKGERKWVDVQCTKLV